MNFSELKTAIANHLHRTDLTSVIPDFVKYAETIIQNDPSAQLPGIRPRANNIRATQSISSQYEDVPTNTMYVRDLQLNTNPVQALTYLSPQDLSRKYPDTSTGKPTHYTIHGDEFEFAPIPDGTYTLEISYHQKFDTLTADSDTNWLLTNHPLVYVYGACIAGASYIESNPQKFMALYTQLAQGINEAEMFNLYGAEVTTKPRTATP